ncbi:hypothetical protein WJX81_000664 [Elliptochloris bilobata]|uniref:Autophagy-related protein 101 n=1 Tax=Elliptochloris bilobata TaxID=381761 RepID=A0AAW1QZT0_9CHLO
MSNCEINNLPTLEVEQHQVREVLRCLLHTIIFSRALGPVRPREVDSELFDITYVQCGDPQVDEKIEAKINQFYGWVEKHPGKHGQVSLSFYEKRKKQSGWAIIGGAQEERLYWEQWCVNLLLVDSSVSQEEQSTFSLPSVRAQRQAKLQAALEELMTLVIRTVNEKKDHIPPVVSSAVLTFSFDISIAGAGSRGGGVPDGGRAAALRAAQRALAARLAGDGQEAVEEFEGLCRGSGSMKAGQANMSRNRYCDVLPYDHNAVVLPGGKYINASYLESAPGEVPSWRYIATQGPMENTAFDFWTMVYSRKCGLILMLTRHREGHGMIKCDPYFPAHPGQSAVYYYEKDPPAAPAPPARGRSTAEQATAPQEARAPDSGWHIACTSVADVDGDVRRRELVITPPGQRFPPRTVVHFSYRAWPDHGVPRTALPLRRLAVAAAQVPAQGPPVMHCSAGIGRTGSFCAVDIALRRLGRATETGNAAAAEVAVDMRRIVAELRAGRWGMVQTLEQYLLCYQAVTEQVAEELAALELHDGRT